MTKPTQSYKQENIKYTDPFNIMQIKVAITNVDLHIFPLQYVIFSASNISMTWLHLEMFGKAKKIIPHEYILSYLLNNVEITPSGHKYK